LKLNVRKFLALKVESHIEVTLKPKARLPTLQCPQPRLRRFEAMANHYPKAHKDYVEDSNLFRDRKKLLFDAGFRCPDT
jgi:hypothetical protein